MGGWVGGKGRRGREEKEEVLRKGLRQMFTQHQHSECPTRCPMPLASPIWQLMGRWADQNFPSPPLMSSEHSDFNNPNSCKPRALYPAFGSDYNRHLRTCAQCPAAYWPMNNCEIPYNTFIHGRWYFAHCRCHSTPTLKHHFLGTVFSLCRRSQSP